MLKVEVVATLYLNLEIPYHQAEALVLAWQNRYPQYDYQTLAQSVLAGDISWVDGDLAVAAYVLPEDLKKLAVQMQKTNGVVIKDRLYNLKIYSRCFVGSEAVQWLMSNFDLTLREAERIGQRMLERNIIRHVVDEQDFRDAYLFYRFT
ncbi:MAG: DEP domain-containing protein [Leptolyngbyaceae cyanobacterium]